MSTLNVNAIQKIGGGKHSRVSFINNYYTLASGITWSTGQDNSTQLIGSVSNGTSSNIFALVFSISYLHEGTTNHGYLNGWYHQTGKTYNVDGQYIQHAHYDWYYNITDWHYTIPWDPAGTQSLSCYVTYAYNTSSLNTYTISTKGFLSQQT